MCETHLPQRGKIGCLEQELVWCQGKSGQDGIPFHWAKMQLLCMVTRRISGMLSWLLHGR